MLTCVETRGTGSISTFSFKRLSKLKLSCLGYREEVVARRRFRTVPRHRVELNTVPRHPVTLNTVPKDTRKEVVYFYKNKGGHYQVQGSEPLNECIR